MTPSLPFSFNYKSAAKEISKAPFFWLLKSSGIKVYRRLFDSHFL